ncbi:MAG: hypothetical protein ACR2PL_08920 [Dehalococcoidia bacterium]
MRASQYGETVWEDVLTGGSVETLAVLQEAVAATEKLLGLDGEDAAVVTKRGQTEWRMDSGWGSEAQINWLLERGYQGTGKFKGDSRVQKLVKAVTAWQETSNAGRDVGEIGSPEDLAKPTQQYAVRTPSKEKKEGYQSAVLFSSRSDLSRLALVDHDDDRAGMEADLTSDKQGFGLSRAAEAQTSGTEAGGVADGTGGFRRPRRRAARLPRRQSAGARTKPR